jgi:hypothetical protein
MFSVITNIYNNCSQPQENWFFVGQRCSMCAPRVTWHTSIRYSNFSRTRVDMDQHGHYIHSHRLAAEMWTTMKNNLLGKNVLSCSFYMYRFRKYVSYGFPIINFCNPGVQYGIPCIYTVHYETSCIYTVHYETPCINGRKIVLNFLVPEAVSTMCRGLTWNRLTVRCHFQGAMLPTCPFTATPNLKR